MSNSTEWVVKVYTVWNTRHLIIHKTKTRAIADASRVINRGLWFVDGGEDVLLPVHMIEKVEVFPQE